MLVRTNHRFQLRQAPQFTKDHPYAATIIVLAAIIIASPASITAAVLTQCGFTSQGIAAGKTYPFPPSIPLSFHIHYSTGFIE